MSPGCFAERLQVPAHALAKVDTAINDASAASLQPGLVHASDASAQLLTSCVTPLWRFSGLGPMGLFLASNSARELYGAQTVIGLARRKETARSGAGCRCRPCSQQRRRRCRCKKRPQCDERRRSGLCVRSHGRGRRDWSLFQRPTLDFATKIVKPRCHHLRSQKPSSGQIALGSRAVPKEINQLLLRRTSPSCRSGDGRRTRPRQTSSRPG